MNKRAQIIQFTYLTIDALFIALSFYIPYVLTYNYEVVQEHFLNVFNFSQLELPFYPFHILVYVLWGMITILILRNFGLHQTARDISTLNECVLVFQALLYALMPVATLILLLKIKIFSQLIFMEAFLLMLILLNVWRIAKRIFVRHLVSRGYNVQNVLIVGYNDFVKTILREIEEKPSLGLHVVGFLLDGSGTHVDNVNYAVLGTISDLEDTVRSHFVDEILVNDEISKEQCAELILQGRRLGITVKVVPDIYELLLGKPVMHNIGDLPVLQYHTKGIHGTDLFIKRLFDIVMSVSMIILFSPIMIAIMAIIAGENKGSVIYSDQRFGKKGKVFNLFKFRTMVINADKMQTALRDKNESNGPIFKIKDDPRVTRVGRILRKYSLDELPQLINVVIGQMSLVGPRPLSIHEVEKSDPRQMKRLEIKPGITCLWQSRGRSDVPFERLLEWDLWYIDNWSFWLDIKILFLTIPAVLQGKGAY